MRLDSGPFFDGWQTNQPGYVMHVAEEIARVRGIPVETVGEATTENFFRLFAAARP